MDERKIPQERPEQTEKPDEYSFLQEVIKDEAGSKTHVKKRVLQMIGYGIVFGMMACFTFCASKPWFENKFADSPKQITIPKDEDEERPEEEQSQQVEEELNTQHYRLVLQSLNQVAAKAGKSVVEVTGLTGEEDWTKESDRNKQSVPGIVVADNGEELLILSKILPVKNVKNIQITFNGGDRYPAIMKQIDHNLDFCIYSIKRNEIKTKTWKKIEITQLGNSYSVEAGDTIVFIGKPFGYADVVNYGTIISCKKDKDLADGIYNLFCTDIPGSREGAGFIVDIQGKVIGIIDQKIAEKEDYIVGYSISGVKEVIELLSNGKSVPYLGISGMDVTGNMENIGIPTGVYVRETEADSPAMQAGIQSGDIITEIDGVSNLDFDTYHNILMTKEEGNQIKLSVSRQGTDEKYVNIDFTVTVGSKK